MRTYINPINPPTDSQQMRWQRRVDCRTDMIMTVYYL